MIIGIGSDIVDIRRIEDIVKRHGQRFIDRCFTNNEQKLLINEDGSHNHGAIARRYAAKEAAAKALGTGIGEITKFHDLEILKSKRGQPILKLSSHIEAFINSTFPIEDDSKRQIRPHISLSDEPPYAVAYVVIEA